MMIASLRSPAGPRSSLVTQLTASTLVSLAVRYPRIYGPILYVVMKSESNPLRIYPTRESRMGHTFAIFGEALPRSRHFAPQGAEICQISVT